MGWIEDITPIAEGKVTASAETAKDLASALISRERERDAYINANAEWRAECERLRSQLAAAERERDDALKVVASAQRVRDIAAGDRFDMNLLVAVAKDLVVAVADYDAAKAKGGA